MTQKTFAGIRVYNIVRTLVFAATVLAGLSSVYYGYIIGTKAIHTDWNNYCSQYHDPTEHTNCMMLSLKLMDEFRKLLKVNLLIALLLPAAFFGGVRLYKQLFPTAKDMNT